MLAIEAARTRLAVAVASETKSTPIGRYRYYLETEEQARRCLKRLRQDAGLFLQERPEWADALETLKQIHSQNRALPICETLRNVVMRLE